MRTNFKVNITLLLSFIVLLFCGCGNQDKSSKTTQEQVIEAPNIDLHAAIYLRDTEAIHQHIKAGSDLNAPEPSRKSSPLITAAALGEPEATKLLIDAGADMNYQNLDGSTALKTATVFGKTKVAKILIDAGADLNIKNEEGSTVLHIAAFFCRKEIVKALLAKGADKSITNNSDKTAYQLVKAPFEKVKNIYDKVGGRLKPLGIEFDYDIIEMTRPIIAELLK